MAKYVTEVLAEINKDPSLLKTEYRFLGDGGPLGIIFRHAFTARGKFLLPDGAPPFKPAPEPMGMTPARLITELRKFSLFVRTDLSRNKREVLYIQLLEGIHPDEAKIVNAIKDQTLTELYPNITREVVADAGYIPAISAEELKQEVAAVKKSAGRRGRPPKSANPQPAL